MAEYWQGLLRKRTSRRAAIAGGTTLAGAAAFWAACGGGSDDSGGGSDRTGLGTRIYDDVKEEGPVKRGGIQPEANTGDPPSFDPYRQVAGVAQVTIGGHMYSRLMKYKSGPGVDPTLVESVPDLAQDYEFGDGGLTVTFKVRPGVKFHNVAPVSGRLLDAEDVVASYTRFSTLPAPQFSNSFKGLVESVTAPDNSTVVFKLLRPNANFISLVTSGQFLWIMPKEMGISVDPVQQVIGTGPWILSDYVQSSRIEYKRNPDYYEQDLPYMDGKEYYVIRETSQALSQFQAGNLWTFIPALANDMKDLAEGNPSLRIYKGIVGINHGGIGFGRGDPDSPFLKDDRVRKALSMSIDRDTISETINDVEGWRALGLEREYRQINFVPGGFTRWWVDPRSTEMGDAAQWFKYDPVEAKKLISAAGYPDGVETELHYASNNYSQAYRNIAEILGDMLPEGGIRPRLVADDYATVHNIKGMAGELPGLVWGISASFSDPDLYLDYLFGPASTRNQMRIVDPEFNDKFQRQQQELDENKRRELLIDMYKYCAGHMRFVPYQHTSIANYELGHSHLKNYWAYRLALGSYGGGTEIFTHRWSDKV